MWRCPKWHTLLLVPMHCSANRVCPKSIGFGTNRVSWSNSKATQSIELLGSVYLSPKFKSTLPLCATCATLELWGTKKLILTESFESWLKVLKITSNKPCFLTVFSFRLIATVPASLSFLGSQSSGGKLLWLSCISDMFGWELQVLCEQHFKKT